MALSRFSSEGVVVLIIDDDEMTRSLLSQIVTAMGGTALTACDGSEGLRMAHEHLPTVAVCDYHMTPVDGACFLSGLRNSTVARAARIPVVMFTSEKDRDVFKRLHELGCADYLMKPFNPQGFSVRLEAIVAKELMDDAAWRNMTMDFS